MTSNIVGLALVYRVTYLMELQFVLHFTAYSLLVVQTTWFKHKLYM